MTESPPTITQINHEAKATSTSARRLKMEPQHPWAPRRVPGAAHCFQVLQPRAPPGTGGGRRNVGSARAGPRSIPSLRQTAEWREPSLRAPGKNAQPAQRGPAGRAPKNPGWNRGEERLKGRRAEEALHTLEMPFAVDPHGCGVHGSRPAPTCWIRRGCRAGGPRKHGSRRPVDPPMPLPFRRLPQPRRSETASACRLPGPGPGSRRRGRGKAQTSGLRRLKI